MRLNDYYYNLTDEQWNGLQRLSSVSKMDIWFYLNHDEYGDFIQDLENNSKMMKFDDGIEQLFSGLSDYDMSCLSTDEEKALKDLAMDLWVYWPWD